MWMRLQGLKLGAAVSTTSHSAGSYRLSHTALNPSSALQTGFAWRRHLWAQDRQVAIGGGSDGGRVVCCDRRLKMAELRATRTAMASQRRCNMGNYQEARKDERLEMRCCAVGSGGGGSAGQSPPQEAVLKAITEVSKAEGRVAQTTNMVLGGTVSEDSPEEWDIIDQKVNVYPMVRGFTAIGIGGDDFVQAMVGAVESVIETQIPEGGVSQKLSAQGKYVSVKIGPVTVNSSDQVRAVYDAMKRDVRMKYFL